MDIKAPCYILAQGNKNRILIHMKKIDKYFVYKEWRNKTNKG